MAGTAVSSSDNRDSPSPTRVPTTEHVHEQENRALFTLTPGYFSVLPAQYTIDPTFVLDWERTYGIEH
jgi:hypothetical protein